VFFPQCNKKKSRIYPLYPFCVFLAGSNPGPSSKFRRLILLIESRSPLSQVFLGFIYLFCGAVTKSVILRERWRWNSGLPFIGYLVFTPTGMTWNRINKNKTMLLPWETEGTSCCQREKNKPNS
jgi:hypothetical protein